MGVEEAECETFIYLAQGYSQDIFRGVSWWASGKKGSGKTYPGSFSTPSLSQDLGYLTLGVDVSTAKQRWQKGVRKEAPLTFPPPDTQAAIHTMNSGFGQLQDSSLSLPALLAMLHLGSGSPPGPPICLPLCSLAGGEL